MINVQTVITSLKMEILGCFKKENGAMFILYNVPFHTDITEASFVHCQRTFEPYPEGFVQALIQYLMQLAVHIHKIDIKHIH